MPLDRYSCEEVFRRIDDYVDRELAASEVAHVRAHLETCAACAGEYAFEADILQTVRDKLRRVAVPEDLRERVAGALRRDSP
jgi:anti-sigma factor (TIGR02949 family)